MAKTKYYIKLSDEERTFLTKIVCEGKDSNNKGSGTINFL